MKKSFLVSLVIISALSLAGCRSYNVAVDITEDQQQKYEATIARLQDKIDNFVPVERNNNVPDLPDFDWFIDKSRAEKRLGMNDEAISTLEKALEFYKFSSIVWHNLAKIYDEAKDCEQAEKYYDILIERVNEQNYHYDIAHCYLRSGTNDEKVRTHYLKYLEYFDERDGEIDEYLGLSS